MADYGTPHQALTGRAAEYSPAVVVTLASASGVRDITATVTDSRGNPLAGVPVTITAPSTIALVGLVPTALVGSLDAYTAAIAGATPVAMIHGQTDGSGVFTARLTLALLVLTGTVAARCGLTVGTVAGS